MKSWLKAPRTPGEPIIFRSLAEMPPLPVSLGPTLNNKTGSWRYIRPLYEDKTPPCNHACPAGSDVVHFIAALREGRLQAAWHTLIAENPLPGVCGRVCPHPCETDCNRTGLGGAIAIHSLERYLADEAAVRGWRPGRAGPGASPSWARGRPASHVPTIWPASAISPPSLRLRTRSADSCATASQPIVCPRSWSNGK